MIGLGQSGPGLDGVGGNTHISLWLPQLGREGMDATVSTTGF